MIADKLRQAIREVREGANRRQHNSPVAIVNYRRVRDLAREVEADCEAVIAAIEGRDDDTDVFETDGAA